MKEIMQFEEIRQKILNLKNNEEIINFIIERLNELENETEETQTKEKQKKGKHF